MVEIPTVKSFCGCCELKIPCIVMATLRMIGYTIGVLAYLYFFVFLELVFRDKRNRYYPDNQVEVLVGVLVLAVAVNIFVTILFIIGALSKNAAKIEYYMIAVGLNVVLFVFLHKIILIVLAAVDCYILLCSHSLYMECKRSSEEAVMHSVYTTVNTVNKDENDPDPLSEASRTQCLANV